MASSALVRPALPTQHGHRQPVVARAATVALLPFRPARLSRLQRPRLVARALSEPGEVLPEEMDDGMSPPGAEGTAVDASTVGASAAATMATSVNAELKLALLDSFYGTERGLSVSADSRAEIAELVLQLEAANPTPTPTDAMSLLAGEWRLVYTANSELLPLLALGRLPLVTVGDIIQAIDGAAGTVENRIALSSPLVSGSVGVKATFEVRSPKRVQIRFEEGQIGMPRLLTGVEIPASVSVLGQTLDLSPLQSVLGPVLQSATELAKSVNASLEGQASQALKFPLPQAGGSGGRAAESYLLLTYLDEELRIARGEFGSMFVLERVAAAGAAPQ